MLEGRVAVVSGVGPGLGRATALALAEEGATVALLARTESTLRAVADEIEAGGGRALPVPTNVADAEQCRRAAEVVGSELGGIDVLVNSAFRGPSFRRFEESDLQRWRKVFDVNVFGSLQLTHAALPYLKERGGSVVFVNSMSTRTIRPGDGGLRRVEGGAPHRGAGAGKGARRLPDPCELGGAGMDLGRQRRGVGRAGGRGTRRTRRGHRRARSPPASRRGASRGRRTSPKRSCSSPATCRGWITGQALDVNGGEWFH